MKKLILLISVILLLNSCKENKNKSASIFTETNENAKDSINSNEEIFALHENETSIENATSKDAAKEWLESLFKCKNGNKFCLYLDTEEKATTKRFYQFMVDSEEIYGAIFLSEQEIVKAKKVYQQKYTGIYPLRKDMEPWLFGRAQDDMLNIKNVKIEKISDLKYRVFIDYGESYQTLNQVTLVKDKNSYLIDYCETEFMD